MAAPQLRLEVSLNLAGFRNEVRKLTQIAQSEFNPLLKVNVDTKDYRAQLKALERIKPVIKIEDSQLDAARARIGTLNKSLATLRRATSTPIEIKLKYTEIGKPPSAAAGQIGSAVSGRVRADQAVAALNQKQAIAARNMLKAADVPVSGLGKSRSLEAYRKSIIDGMTNAGKESIAGLAQGLKNGQSAISQAAKTVGDEGVRAIKDSLGIASPSRVFKQIGEFSVDGLELGFLNGLKDFKGKSVAEIRKIVALLKLELAKVSEGGGIGGPSMGSLRRQLVGQRAYTSPIGPLPVGSREPYAKGTRGQFGYSGYEPRMVSRPYTGGPRFPVEGMMAPRPEFGFASTGQSQPTGQAAGRSRENTILGAMGGYNPGVRSSAMFPMGGMMGPSSPLGRITPQSSMFGGGGGGGGSGGGGASPFGGMRLNVPQLPGSGVVRELGEEFGFAAKQVLLFGTAYKALAFLQSFPGQVGEAVGALQSFRNTLKTVTPSAAEFDKSSKFILSLVDQYNVPLQSARDGFAKLYASMKPAGFSGAEIRGLFEGVSMGAATFGMSADKVDRVMYAFAQMASKGQVMSEELKGQLGDALPGALSLFAKAADMSVQEFGQAMEDGAFKGEAMRQLLVNVGATMKEEFGKGAVGAAVTYQGVMNRLQTTTVLFYEAFEPAAVAFANTFILPITNGIRIVTDAFAQLLTGQKAITQGGSELAARMQPLIPIFQGIGDNLRQVATAAFNTVKALLPVVQFLLQLAASPVTGFLAQMYASLLLLNGAFTLLGGRLLIGVIASLAQTAIRMTALNAATVITNGSLAGTQLQLRMLSAGFAQTGAAATGFAMTMRTAMMTTVVGAIVAAVAIGIAEFMRLRGVMASIEGRYKSLGDQARLMGEAGNVSGVQKITTQVKEQAQTYEDLAKALNRAEKAGGFLKLDQKGRELLKRTGQSGFDAGTGIITNEDANKIKDAINRNREETKNLLGSVLPGQESKARAEAAKLDAKLEKQKVDLSAGDGTGKPPKEQSLESYYGLQDTLAKNAADFAAAQTEEEFRHKIELLEMYYDIQETRANAYQKDAIKFEREMVMIEERRKEARLKAQLDVQRAQASVAGGAGGGGAGSGGKGLGAGIAQYITGDPSSPFYRADHGGGNYHEHLAFVSRQAAEEAYKKLTSAGIQVTEFKGKSRVGRHTPGSAHYEGLAFDVPGAQVPVGRERELTARVQSTLGIGGARPAPVPASQKRDAVAEQNTIQASIAKTAKERMADAKAVQEQIVALEKYRDSAFPTVEQETQNKLLAKRNELFRSGMTDEQIDKEIKLYENQERGTAALAAVQRLYDGNIIKLDKYNELMAIFNRDIATQNTLLQQNATLMAQAKFDQTIKGIRDQIAMARSITPDQEMRTQIAQEGYVGDQAESVFQERKTLQGAQKLKEDMQGIASSIGNSFGEAFKGIITGSMTAQEALAGMFQSIADHFADMVAQMIAEWIKMMILKGIEAIINPMAGLGNLGGGISSGLSSGFSAGAASAVPTDAAGWGASFGTSLKFANGGIALGGFTAFANGGMVTGPTMGLVGEGRYNEAIVPLPDGKSIPVELAGGGSSSPTVIVNVDAKGSQVEGNEQNANQLGRVISAAVQTELIKQQRPGGLLAR